MKNNALDSIHCMVKLSLDIQDLIKNYPPEYKNPSKKLKYEEALERFRNQQGSVKVSRWKYGGSDVWHLKKAPLKIDFRDEYFCYDDGDSESEHIFYLNYADPLLFGFYDGDLFAQDELQTLEHPLLGSVMEYIDKNESDSLKSRTEEHGEPTPYIVEGVPYWLKVVTAPVLPDGKVYNFYGRNFSRASKEILDLAVTPLSKEKRNNIIAMAAPSTGSGEYKRKELEQLMKTVIVAFSGAVEQTCVGGQEKCIIHTGNWGAGAFGNNRELIYLAQIIGASCAGVEKLIFHAVDKGDFSAAEQKFSLWNGGNLLDCVDYLCSQHYFWQS